MSNSPPATSTLRVSVVIPTHNPRMDYLQRVLEALRVQTLPREQWELLVVDNNSQPPLRVGIRHEADGKRHGTSLPSHVPTFPPFTELELSWHSNARVVREEELGLTFARLRGFAEARGELIVIVDDDNVLAPDYLETAVRIAQEHPMLGAFGGKSLPEFEVEPEGWLRARGKGLGLRDRGDREEFFPEAAICEASVCQGAVSPSLGSVEQFLPSVAPHAVSQTRLGKAVGGSNPPNDRSTEPKLAETALRQTPNHRVTRRVTEFPDCAPIGAGMVLRREAARAYAERLHRRSGLRVAGGGSEEGQRTDVGDRRSEGIRHTADGEWQGAGDRRQEPEVRGRMSDVGASPNYCPTELPNHRAASVITDRRGDSLASGGDNDICLTVIEEGWQVGYLPQLRLTHLIPKGRMTLDYHKRMARDSMTSFILMLDQHGIRPWPAMPKWALPLRVACDWWRVKPWRGPQELLRFWGHVGMYEGRAALQP